MATNRLNDKIEFITASAGTGKTFQLVKIVHDAVADGSARPEGIMATTFTSAAASELQERLALRFHEGGRHQEALRLDTGYIGTVHSICFDLLSRFAFEAGLPPEMRVLDETEASLLLTRAMDEVIDQDATLALMELADRLGQKNDRSGDYYFPKMIRSLVGEARANDIPLARLPAMGDASWAEMEQHLEPASPDDLDSRLKGALASALQLMPTEPVTKGSRDYRAFLEEKQRKFSGGLAWSEWLKLSSSKPTKAELECTEAVRLVASQLEENARFHGDLKTYLGHLFGIASRVGDRYQSLKRERGVVDFQDLEKEMLDLLRSSAFCRELLEEEIDLLVVDEFQDTSPIQLALFSELGKCARRVVWVGDVKQSIYEFRGADPELIRSAVSGAQKQAPLDTSWRSLPDLVSLANTLFAAPFEERIHLPKNETIISAHRQAVDASVPSIELASLTSGEAYKNGNPIAIKVDQKAELLADLIEDALERGDPVVEKRSVTPEDPGGTARPLRAGDIAILVRKHDRAAAVAESLRLRGLDVVIGGAGLLATPECRLALACFRRMLDAGDSLASAEIVVFENQHPGEDWLEQRIRYVTEAEEKELDATRWGLEGDLISPALVQLETLREEKSHELLSPLQRFDRACAAADVTRIMAAWGPTKEHFHQREANLEQLRNLISEYEERGNEFGVPATIMGLFARLDEIQSAGEDKRAVDPGMDAIHISTYHGAKGLEWPVVITADLDSKLKTRLFSLRSINTTPGGETRLEDPLANRELRLWLNPFGRSKSEFLEKMESSDMGQTARRNAEDEELRLLYVGMTRARDRLILPIERGIDHPWLKLLGAPGEQLQGIEQSGSVSLGPEAPSLSLRFAEFRPAEEAPLPPESADHIPFPIRVDSETERIPAVMIPSSQEPLSSAAVGEIIAFGERLAWKGNPDPGTVGDVMHRIFAVEILNPESDEGARLQRISDLLVGYDLASHLEPSAVAATVDRYRAFVKEQFSPISEQVEVPFSYLNEAGQRVSGFIDHLLETEAGPVILDHKIFPGKREDWEKKALSYSGQLGAYAGALGENSPPRIYIHLVTAGALIEVFLAQLDHEYILE